MKDLKYLYQAHKFLVIFALVGFITALLFVTVGFFRTIFVFAFAALCGFIGHYLEKNGYFR
ncbi:DUF2273 domain-containing protein [Eremococcus coleocola]|uniref:DUF2273 domain-containing protein n=1 Tax=Eremococcus coleocola ACS-139-V-Col8 TaxID=908337 RepID=E4KPX6_9LACT|nr:DUF2273 domain-containing protein [Eremococcus coleocola]EFR31078.1 hypothetical protein HMPREF9257_1615 [Eremococcus coleocola ACS-139-V-Col8]